MLKLLIMATRNQRAARPGLARLASPRNPRSLRRAASPRSPRRATNLANQAAATIMFAEIWPFEMLRWWLLITATLTPRATSLASPANRASRRNQARAAKAANPASPAMAATTSSDASHKSVNAAKPLLACQYPRNRMTTQTRRER